MKYLTKQEAISVLGVFPYVLERHIKLGDITPVHCVSRGSLFKEEHILKLKAVVHPSYYVIDDVPDINQKE